jgi:hypothetical protein
MLQDSIEQFKIFAPLQMPDLFDTAQLTEVELTEDYALLSYILPQDFPFTQLVDYLDEQMGLVLLYSLIPSDSITFGRNCCAFANPVFGHHYKINAHCDDDGNCNGLYVTIYGSLEYMGEQLRHELRRVASKGRFAYQLSEDDLIMYLI